MSRLIFDELPETYEAAKAVLNASFRSLREVLEHGFRAKEQLSRTVEVVIDTSDLPLPVEVDGMKNPPMCVLVLRALEQGADAPIVISCPAVSWEWRAGRVIIHAVGTLAAATRYNAVLAVME